MSVRRVTLTLQFTAIAPDDEAEGDEWADKVGDQIIATLERDTPDTVYDQTFSVVDWDDAPETRG